MHRYLDVPLRMDTEPVRPLLDWARSALANAGYQRIGEPDAVRQRSWSIVARLPTDRGPVWAKANARGFAYEAALLELLDRHAPGHVLPPIAVDAGLGRLISPDGGAVLDDAGRTVTEDEWLTLLTGYADLQRRIAPHLETIQQIGVLDCSPTTLPGWYRLALDRIDLEPHVRPLIADRRDRLDALLPDTERWADQLAASPVPLSVEHNDLHADNVFAGTAELPGLRIFDWGDATITHPFTGLRRALLTASGTDEEHAAELEWTAVDTDRLRDAYLRCWLDGADNPTPIPTALLRDADLAGRMSWIVLAASWLRLPVGLNEEFGGYYAEILLGYLDAAGG